MTRFVKSPFWNNWFEGKKVEHSLIVCSPYFKKNALDKIIDQFELDDDESILDVKILIRGKLDDFLDSSSDITALDALLALRCIDVDNVRRVTNLHMKAYLSDQSDLLVGSGNCTKSGLSFGDELRNVEGGIQTNELSVINDFEEYFMQIFNEAEKLETFYDDTVERYKARMLEPLDPYKKVSFESANEKKAKYDYREKKGSLKKIDKTGYEELTAADIPQFSNFNIVLNESLIFIKEETEKGKLVTFDSLGKALPGRKIDTDVAIKKYGENHAKAGEILGLVTILPQQKRLIQLSPLGELYLSSSKNEKDIILAKQLMNSSIVKAIYSKYEDEPKFDIEQFLKQYLSESTVKRRKPNVKKFFTKMEELGIDGAKEILNDLF